jgi:hypothetical protein
VIEKFLFAGVRTCNPIMVNPDYANPDVLKHSANTGNNPGNGCEY